MAKFNQEDGKSYTEFFAFRFTRASDIDDIADSDDCRTVIWRYAKSNPPEGWFRRYWSNGNKRYEWEYKGSGKQIGTALSWWPNGDRKSEWTYDNGKRSGPMKAWYENGAFGVTCGNQLAAVGNYSGGKKYGHWIDYWPNGQKWFEGDYHKGTLTKAKYWKEDGSEDNKSCHKKGEQILFKRINPNYNNRFLIS